jgi:hypothetical protein
MREQVKRRMISGFHIFCIGVAVGAATCSFVTSLLGSANLQTTMLVGIGTGIGVALWSLYRGTDA